MGASREDILTHILDELVRLKDGPRDEHYRDAKEMVWAQARAALVLPPRVQAAEDQAQFRRMADRIVEAVNDCVTEVHPLVLAERHRREDVVAELHRQLAALESQRDLAKERLNLARDALILDGYFTETQVDDDVASRIVELCSYLRSQWDAALAELARVQSGRPVFRGERRDV